MIDEELESIYKKMDNIDNNTSNNKENEYEFLTTDENLSAIRGSDHEPIDFATNRLLRRYLYVTGWYLTSTSSKTYSCKDGYKVTSLSGNKLIVEDNIKTKFQSEYLYRRDVSKIKNPERFKELCDELEKCRYKLDGSCEIPPAMYSFMGIFFNRVAVTMMLLAICIPFPLILGAQAILITLFFKKHPNDIKAIKEYKKKEAEIKCQIDEIADFSKTRKKEKVRIIMNDILRSSFWMFWLLFFISFNIYVWYLFISGFYKPL